MSGRINDSFIPLCVILLTVRHQQKLNKWMNEWTRKKGEHGRSKKYEEKWNKLECHCKKKAINHIRSSEIEIGYIWVQMSQPASMICTQNSTAMGFFESFVTDFYGTYYAII